MSRIRQDIDHAEAFLDRARRLATEQSLITRIENLRGLILRSQGKFREAEEALLHTLEMARASQDTLLEASALLNISFCKQGLSRYDEEVQWARDAIQAATRIGARRQIAWAHTNMGIALYRLGEFERSREEERLAVTLFQEIGERQGLVNAQGEIGNAFYLEGDTRNAAKEYEKAFDLAKEYALDEGMALWSSNLAARAVEAGAWDQVEHWNRIAAKIAGDRKDETRLLYVNLNDGLLAEARGNGGEAIQRLQEVLKRSGPNSNLAWNIHAALGRIYARSSQFKKANAEFETALGIIEHARAGVDSTFRISLLARLIKYYQDYVDVLVAQGNDERALEIVDSSRARVLTERLGRGGPESIHITRTGLRKLAASANASLLSFWIAPNRSFAWLITAQGVERFELPAAPEIQTLADSYRKVLEGDPLAPKDDSAAKLSAALLASIAPKIPKNSRVVVVPDGPLHRLNLEALPMADGHYWIEDVELAVAPSLSVLDVQPAAQSKSALLIGAALEVSRDYPRLANAGVELDHIAARFPGNAVLRGAAATPGCYRASNPAGYSYIHFAAHAEANRENPLDSAVILSRQGNRFKLYAREVIDIPIHANLVTISSCKGAGVRAYAGEGLIGFSWAFLKAGSRAVVAGLSDVSDNRTEPLMNELYAGIASGADPITALRRAKLAMLHSPGSKPYFWAPFQIYVRTL